MILAFTELSDVSILDDDVERPRELALVAARAVSRLEEDDDK